MLDRVGCHIQVRRIFTPHHHHRSLEVCSIWRDDRDTYHFEATTEFKRSVTLLIHLNIIAPP